MHSRTNVAVLLAVPRHLKLEEAASFLYRLQKWSTRGEVIVDFSNIAWVYPAGTVCLAVGMKRWLEDRNALGLTTTFKIDYGSPGCGYLAAFGFFDQVGYKVREAHRQAESKANFVILTAITRDDVSFDGIPEQQKLDEASFALAKRLMRTGDDEHPMVQAVGYSMREAIRNVFEHADCDEAVVMAQQWANGKAEIALGDSGIGIFASLSKSLAVRNESHALELAIQPGITEYTGPETNDPWQNSGFGLYMLSQVGRTFGRIQVASSGHLLEVDRKGNRLRATNAANATVVGLQVEMDQDYYFNNFLKRTVEEGERRAATIRGARKQASPASGGGWR